MYPSRRPGFLYLHWRVASVDPRVGRARRENLSNEFFCSALRRELLALSEPDEVLSATKKTRWNGPSHKLARSLGQDTGRMPVPHMRSTAGQASSATHVE